VLSGRSDKSSRVVSTRCVQIAMGAAGSDTLQNNRCLQDARRPDFSLITIFGLVKISRVVRIGRSCADRVVAQLSSLRKQIDSGEQLDFDETEYALQELVCQYIYESAIQIWKIGYYRYM
jgi:hypothetical protein